MSYLQNHGLKASWAYSQVPAQVSKKKQCKQSLHSATSDVFQITRAMMNSFLLCVLQVIMLVNIISRQSVFYSNVTWRDGKGKRWGGGGGNKQDLKVWWLRVSSLYRFLCICISVLFSFRCEAISTNTLSTLSTWLYYP